ncbi:MAG: dTDP-4-dehydrorhamnose 3,5-epimerase [Bacteroidales bacterium]|nr:dTDP-4-dehydrorhamnose 3,5-epimerase [Bacteroidales bacterium]
MKIKKTSIEGLVIVEPEIFRDGRGYFYESYNARDFEAATGIKVEFVQDNQAFSRYGVLRGLHFQLPPHDQAKLVSVVRGKVIDVAVDLRKGSPTYGRYEAVELSGDNHLRLFIPRGFAHGYLVLSRTALFQYKCDGFYAPKAEGGLAWNDPAIGIDWPVPAKDIILSEKDRNRCLLKDFDSPFIYR